MLRSLQGATHASCSTRRSVLFLLLLAALSLALPFLLFVVSPATWRKTATLLGRDCPQRTSSQQVMASRSFTEVQTHPPLHPPFGEWPASPTFYGAFGGCDPTALRIVPPEGTPPSPVCPSLIVSANFDLGRSQWSYFFSRSDEGFRARIERTLSYTNHMVFFTSYDQVDSIVASRRALGLMDRTWVVGLPLRCLPEAPLERTATGLMCLPTFLKGLFNFSPERLHPWYNLLMWSKVGFMEGAAALPWPAPVDAQLNHVTWVDAGCASCVEVPLGICIAPHTARPDKLRITQIAVFTAEQQAEPPADFAASRAVVFAGTIFGISRARLGAFRALWRDTITWLLTQGVVDQDQTVFAQLYLKHPNEVEPYIATSAWPWEDVVRNY